MDVTAGRVICMDEARRRRGMMTPAPAPEPPVVPDRALVAASQEAMELAKLTRRVETAISSWTALRPPAQAGSISKLMPALVAAIRSEPAFARETGSLALRKGLLDRHGDARLARAALMTPQELLALPGVGQADLSYLIEELGARAPLTIPEMVTGAGKATLRIAMGGSERVRALMSLRAGLVPGSRPLA